MNEASNGDNNSGVAGVMYDPQGVNLSDPEELEAHLQVLDVRQRLRQRRRRMIRLFSMLFCALVLAFMVMMGLSSREAKENFESSQGTGTSTVVLPSPPADLASRCSSASLETTQGVEVCEEACEVAECCTVPSGYALSCLVNNAAVCAQYQRYCDNLDSFTSVVISPTSADSPVSAPVSSSISPQTPAPVAPTPLTLSQEIDLACTDIEEDDTTCATLCSPSVCCFSSYCLVSPEVDCQDYSGCYVLHTDLESGEDDDQTTGTDSIVSQIHTACYESGTIVDATSNSECTSLCAPGACCFESSLACTDVTCVNYAECNILYPSFLAVTQAEVEDACGNHRDVAGSTEPTLCEQVCSLLVMQCCFHQNNDQSCTDLQQPGTAYCDNYAACDILGTDGTDVSAAHQAELVDVCANSATRAECITLCAAATCCYASTLEEACANVDASITCDDYSACDVLYST
eukprot:Nitzschia sp. Nitz4//scaffold91_size79674//55556//56938//NITZ4_005375-RA/size79674-processed-gene-0.110-mRNA-1//-1//CDS//3329560124//7889//frame0